MGATIPPKAGLHLSGMFDAMERNELHAAHVLGENPAQSEADQQRAVRLLEGLEHLVVQDIFLTRTGELADVVLPAAASWCEGEGTVTSSERRVQRVRKALDPPGEARDDIWILCELARRLGHDLGVPTAEEAWNELRSLSPMHAGMSYERLEANGGLQWPCPDEEHPGELFLHARLWEEPVRGPRAPFLPSHYEPPVDELDESFPIRLTTGRRLDSFNTGVQSRGYYLAAPARRGDPARPGGRRAVRGRRRRARTRGLAPRRRRGARPARPEPAPGPGLHDAALPGRGRHERADDRRDRPEVRDGGVQGVGDQVERIAG